MKFFLKRNISRNISWFQMSLKSMDDIWTPLIYFGNAFDVQNLHSFGSSKSVLGNLWFNNEHSFMKHSIKFTTTLSCRMNFNNFPYDEHRCFILIINYEGAKYRVFLNQVKIYTYNLKQKKEVGGKKIEVQNKGLDYRFNFESKGSFDFFENGFIYSMAKIEVKITRTKNGQAKIFSTFFVPVCVFAITSLASYFIKPDQVPGRFGFLIILCLIIVNSYNSINAPSRRGFSPIEVWFVGNLFPILLGILEFGLALLLKKYIFKSTTKFRNLDLIRILKKMDLFTFALLILYLICFNVYYWMF